MRCDKRRREHSPSSEIVEFMYGDDGERLRSSPERRASTDLCTGRPMSAGQQVRSAKPYRPSRLQESGRTDVLFICGDTVAERGPPEAHI